MFNGSRTFVPMAATKALFLVSGAAIGGPQGMVVALLFALAMRPMPRPTRAVAA